MYIFFFPILLSYCFLNYQSNATSSFENLPSEIITRVIKYTDEDSSTLRLINKQMLMLTEKYLKHGYVEDSSQEIPLKSKNLSDILAYLRRKQECKNYYERAFLKHEMTALYSKDAPKVVNSALKCLKYWPSIEDKSKRENRQLWAKIFHRGKSHCHEEDKVSKTKLNLFYGATGRAGYLETARQDRVQINKLEVHWVFFNRLYSESSPEFLDIAASIYDSAREEVVNLLSLKCQYAFGLFLARTTNRKLEAFNWFENAARDQNILKCNICRDRDERQDHKGGKIYTIQQQIGRMSCKNCKKGAYGYAPAQYKLGEMILAREGVGDNIEDISLGIKCLQYAAFQNYSPAHSTLGLLCSFGYATEEYPGDKDRWVSYWWDLACFKGNTCMRKIILSNIGENKYPFTEVNWIPGQILSMEDFV